MSWPEYLERHYVARTVQDYQRDVGHYLLWLGGEAAALRADYATIIRYTTHLRKHYAKLGTLRRILAAIKVYHWYLLRSGRRPDHPADNLSLRGPQPRRGIIQLQNLLTGGELQSLLAAPAEYYGPVAGRAVPLVSLLVHQALCLREVIGLQLGSLDLKAATVTVPASKRTNGRRLPLAGKQILTLQHYLNEERPRLLRPDRSTDHLFLTLTGGAEQKQGVATIIRKLRPLVNDKAVTALLIRQSVIAHKLSQGEGLRQVQVFAGHKKVSTTESYRETNLEELRRSVDRFHPLAGNSLNH